LPEEERSSINKTSLQSQRKLTHSLPIKNHKNKENLPLASCIFYNFFHSWKNNTHC